MAEESEEDVLYNRWKSRILLLYDAFENHNLTWPSWTVAWGKLIRQTDSYSNTRMFMGRSTDAAPPAEVKDGDANVHKYNWKGHSHLLQVCTAKMTRERCYNDSRMGSFDEEESSNHITIDKRIVHPGGINRIKVMRDYPDIVVTHTESVYTYLWDTQRQKERGKDPSNEVPNTPDLILKGHTEHAVYALDTGPDNMIASGGQDSDICIWSMADAQTVLTESSSKTLGTVLSARAILKGHTETVEEVNFHPTNGSLLVSCGDDKNVLFWDLREKRQVVEKFDNIHSKDVNCISWNPFDHNYLITGGSDTMLCLVDKRKNTGPVHTIDHHKANVTTVQWQAGVNGTGALFASAAEDGRVCIWDRNRINANQPYIRKLGNAPPPPELIFEHAGHRTAILYFDWSTSHEDGFTFASVSDDSAHEDYGGGTLQLWRPSDLVTRARGKVVRDVAKLDVLKKMVF